MNINKLNLDCFLEIFSRLSLQNKIILRLVCRQWNYVIETEICNYKTSLKLFGSKTNLLNYCKMLADLCLNSNEHFRNNFCLYQGGYDDEIVGGEDCAQADCYFLPSLFPNVTKLTVDYDSLVDIDVPNLLRQWRNLTMVTLRHADSTPNLLRTITAISSLPALKTLALVNYGKELNSKNTFKGIDNSILNSNNLSKMPLTILSQLEQFVLAGYAICGTVELLSQLGPNLRHLVIGDMRISFNQWQQWLHSNVMNSITHLTVYNQDRQFYSSDVVEDLLTLISAHMPLLTSLNINNFFSIPSSTVCIRRLSSMSNLNELHICLSHRNIYGKKELRNRLNSLPQLCSVTKLYLQPQKDVIYFHMTYSHLFPQLQTLLIKSSNSELVRHIAQNMRTNFPKIKKLLQLFPDFRGRHACAFAGRHEHEFREFISNI